MTSNLQQSGCSGDVPGAGVRIALLASLDPDDPSAISGTLHSMMMGLRRQGATVHPVSYGSLLRRMFLKLPRSLRIGLKRVSRLVGWQDLRLNDRSQWSREKHSLVVSKQAYRAGKRLRRHDHDVILGCLASAAIPELEAEKPIFYYSDATPHLINTTYPRYEARSASYKAACDEFEAGTLARVEHAAYATRLSADAAVERYGLDRRRAHVVPMGANIVMDDLGPCDHDPLPPSRSDLKLCIIAADPVRKQLATAAAAVQVLVERGWNARLTHAGAPCDCLDGLSMVEYAGHLSLARDDERKQLARIMAESHVMIMPSLGEAFGIAVAEAAAFGRPSVVSDAGGLPEVVVDGETGIVVPVGADGNAYADAIERIVGDEHVYRRMSKACLQRSKDVLNWDVWAEKMLEVIVGSVAGGR